MTGLELHNNCAVGADGHADVAGMERRLESAFVNDLRNAMVIRNEALTYSRLLKSNINLWGPDVDRFDLPFLPLVKCELDWYY